MEIPTVMDGMLKNAMALHDDRSSRNSNSSSGSPSVIHEKKKMLDITRDKPIKIAVRVQVPVRDHPKFNFVGKLLGPKGNSLKRLQEETMCKMAVLGKGSMRDRKKEEELRLGGDPRYAHLSEDLHVEISTYTAPAEAHARIAYALAEVRRFLVPDYHDDIRQEQMWEMQALNSAQNATNGTGVNCNGTTTSGTTISNGHMNTNGSVALNGNSINGNPEMMHHHQSSGADSIVSNGGGILSATVAAAAAAASTAPPTSGSEVSTSQHHSQHSTNLTSASSHHHHIQQQHQQQQQQQQQHHHHHHQFLSSSAADAVAAAATDLSNLMPVDVNMTSASHFVNSLPTTDIEAQTLAFVESANAFLHPALRGVKTVSLARKRPLLGGPRSSMNPTKRTVMTLIARARTAQAMHGSRSNAPIGEPIQVITSPLILQPPLDLLQTSGTGSVQKENILQGA
ncbi:KH domain-containing, RNA-binding, signal transduction-associated protein 2 isoform X2 [Toxorhynchites rutilus septentrionalis]|uniref:KH domain-containing, RNA-binding, signal transduction-associated protein 2 isoform X2 n=1 Tax=Toxorhynchites rutilus septentrionalis TaxID=329112 RepID=UPI00247A5C53|nr:KH domain-containing, RNA-binding, signal transduction-associated protein 2 isoform X2 [Toxorhynchites rutilus septentrionalis]